MRKTITSSGLEFEEIKKGDGPPVSSVGQLVSVHYDVALTYDDLDKGNIIDSSNINNNPLSFKVGVGEVLQGVDEGIQTMRVGDLRRLIIPPGLAFGERGIRNLIPPNSTLYVDIKLRFIESS